jgi:hypothetical protein
MREPLAEGSSQGVGGHVFTTIEASNPTTQIPHSTHPHTSTQSHDVSIDTRRPEGPVGQPSAQEEAFTIDPAVQNQYPHQQTETLEDALQDSEEEIEAVIEDELVHLHQENEHLLLVQQQMIR